MKLDNLLHILILAVAFFAVLYALHVFTVGVFETSVGLISSVDDDLRTPSPLTSMDLDRAFKAIGADSMIGLGKAFKLAEAEYGVNASFLAAVAVHESDKGTSRIAREKNNLFGWGASDHDPYASANTFLTLESGISVVAYRLRTIYFDQLGLTTLRAVGSRYATDPEWAKKVLYWARRIQEVSNDE